MIFRIVCLSVFALCPLASGEVMLHITGIAGAGVTSWSWSGAGIVLDDPGADSILKMDDLDEEISFGWFNWSGGDWWTSDEVDARLTTLSENTAQFTTGGETYSIVGIGAEDSSPDSSFGLALDDGDDFDLGQELVFSGSFTAAVDLNDLTIGTHSAQDWRKSETDDQLDLVIRVNISADTVAIPEASSASVPEPSTFAFLGLGAMGMGVVAYRRKKNQVA